MAGGEGGQRRDVFPGHVQGGRVVGSFAGRGREVPDPERGDGVEGEALPRVAAVATAA